MQAVCNQTSFESDFSRILVCVAVQHDINGSANRLPVSLLSQFNLYNAKYIRCADAHIKPSGRSQMNNTKFLRSGFHPGCAEVKSNSKMLTMQTRDVAR
jgi:hypothetical protein